MASTRDLREIIADALDDAFEYRQAGDCSDCARLGAPCEDHAADAARAAEYAAAMEARDRLDIRELTPHEVETVAEVLEHARDKGRRVRVTWDDGLKVKVGEGTWSPPLGDRES